ncbi:MAG: hypothetical protein CFR70_13540 [Rhodocyclaceae bacterium]|nr:HDOD domain-containing protein [Dechloromonas sp.]TEX44494.1 MAG: hypothetical protein CFR70_13540 [Rhodocyclaceae bacterium]
MLFKVVGNPACRQHQPFESVEAILHAVCVRQTFNLVQAIALAIAQNVRHHRELFYAYWARSQAIGQLAMLVADERVAVCNMFPVQAYVAGLFHDYGVPPLIQRFPTYCAKMHLGEPGGWPDLAEEDAKLNADDCVVGYLVARPALFAMPFAITMPWMSGVACCAQHVGHPSPGSRDLLSRPARRQPGVGSDQGRGVARTGFE